MSKVKPEVVETKDTKMEITLKLDKQSIYVITGDGSQKVRRLVV